MLVRHSRQTLFTIIFGLGLGCWIALCIAGAIVVAFSLGIADFVAGPINIPAPPKPEIVVTQQTEIHTLRRAARSDEHQGAA